MTVGEIPAGTRLVETEIAERLQVSRTPVREALRRLESDGFVQRNRRRGLTVTAMGPDDVGDIGLLRAQVDRLAATLASERSGQQDWVVAERCIDRMEQIGGVAGPLSIEFHAAHVDFHRSVYRLGFSPRLASYLETHLLEYIETAGLHYLGPRRETGELVEEHRILLAALSSGDARVAADAAEHHARQAADRMKG